MKLTQASLANPVAVLVAVLLLLLFGVISLSRLPVQLTPEIEKPEITISTNWRSAAPEEVEAEIIEPQEQALRGLPGAVKFLAQAQRGRGKMTVTFAVGTDLRRALLEIMNRLNRVASYPQDADEPVISAVGGNSRPIAWFIVKTLPGNERDIASYQDFIEEVVQSRFERIPGVAMSEVRGGRENELRITFDPYKAANLGIELPRVVRRIGSDDISAGYANVGKRRYTLRYTGAYRLEDLGEMILEWNNGHPIYLRDIATIKIESVDRSSFVMQNGQLAIAVNAHRETGVNVLQVMAGLHAAVDELRAGPLADANLSFEQVYDETIYIDRSISMVRNNLSLGILLAIGVLWWFLRSWRATLMVAIAIPVSLLGSFILLDIFGRTVNVISLAGMAFAVGMVLDAAIIVLENIIRHREMGKTRQQSSLLGSTQVWGALLASTVTTVAIFLPVVFLRDEAGQMFADLALTIAVAVCFSLLFAVTVLPALAMKGMQNVSMQDKHLSWWSAITEFIMDLTATPRRRTLWIVALILIPIVTAVMMKPETDYLPEGKRNMVLVFISAPPGLNIDAIEKEMGAVIAEKIQPYIDGDKEPRVKNYFFVAFSGGMFMGIRTVDPGDTDKLLPIVNGIIGSFPDTIGFARRSSLFGGFSSGKSISVDIQGRNLEALLQAASNAYANIGQALPGARVRPISNLDLTEPELRMQPNEMRIAEVGWDRSAMASIIRALGSGLYAGDYFDGEQSLDVMLRTQPWKTPEELAAIPLATPNAGIVPLGDLVSITRTAGPDELRRVDRRRTVTLRVTPQQGISLEETLGLLRDKVEPQILAELPEGGTVSYAGTADKLQTALKSMSSSFVLAIIILYLLISALFRSFLDSLLVLLVLPLATVGGVIALQLMNWFVFQPMDLLTMIGFIILLGLVINNAILLVHQTRVAERQGVSRQLAVRDSVRMRLRPILMSTMTSIFGMLPLLLLPGAGSELYRGLAAVIVGGMLLSTVFTLVLLPSLLRHKWSDFFSGIHASH